MDVTVTTVGGTSATSAADHFTYVAPPTVTSVSPTSGLAAGGTSVTITGTNLTGATAVTLGGTAATLGTNTGTSLVVTTGAHAAASGVSVLVTTPGGTNAANTLYTYVAPPTVTSSTADLAVNATTLTITGTGFDPAGTNTVVFNNGAVGTASASSTTSLTVTLTTAPTSLGSLTAVVTTDGFSSGTPVQVAAVVTAYSLWRFNNFGTTSTAGNLADTASYAGDGISNLMKYALGLNPLVAASPGTVSTIVKGSANPLLSDRLAISVTVPNPTPSDVTYIVQATADLVNWTTVATKVGTGAWVWNTSAGGSTSHIVDAGTTPDTVQVGDILASSGNARRMMRLEVTNP